MSKKKDKKDRHKKGKNKYFRFSKLNDSIVLEKNGRRTQTKNKCDKQTKTSFF